MLATRRPFEQAQHSGRPRGHAPEETKREAHGLLEAITFFRDAGCRRGIYRKTQQIEAGSRQGNGGENQSYPGFPHSRHLWADHEDYPDQQRCKGQTQQAAAKSVISVHFYYHPLGSSQLGYHEIAVWQPPEQLVSAGFVFSFNASH